MSFDIVCVVGLGYIGLPTAAMFAKYGKQVFGVDINQSTVDTVNAGKIHIIEPELDTIVSEVVANGKLRAMTSPEPADAFLIAVPTPFIDDHEPDLRFIEAAARSIAPVLVKGNLVILESTSPVGATEMMAACLAEERTDLSFPQQVGEQADINIAHCPERVLPGQIVRELVENDRVIGGMSKQCSTRSAELYQTFVKGECVVTNVRTAEMAKLTENAFRDVNIAFANELSVICDEIDIDVWELIRLTNHHPRVDILQPGPGVGGHCIAVDPWFIVSKTPNLARVMRAARQVNDNKPQWVVEQVKAACFDLASERDCSPAELTVACLGLAFKANIDDLRESPALAIAAQLSREGSARVLVCEPHITKMPGSMATLQLVPTEEALRMADVIVLLVDHDEFKAIEKDRLAGKRVIDTRGIWSLNQTGWGSG